MEKYKHEIHAANWLLSGIVLALLNFAIWLAGRLLAPNKLSGGSPTSWAGSILLVIAMFAVDLIWLALFVMWVVKRRMGIPEEEPVVHPSSEHPADDPGVKNKKEEN